MSATADLIDLGGIVQLGEITSFLACLGVRLSNQRLHRYWFVLEELNLIRKTKDGHNIFYLAGAKFTKYVDYAYKQKGKPWDRQQVKDDLRVRLFELEQARKPVFERFLWENNE